MDHLTELHGTRQEAVGALMGRFATREEEVDDLFRLGVFTDLYRVVRQGVRAGVENYSIKRLEPLCGYDRRVDLAEATRSLIALEAALEDGTAAGAGDRQRVVAGYNEDDCRATPALRDWLEERRAELAERLGQELPRPAFAEKPGAAEDPETARIRSALLAGVSAETSGAIAWDVSAETSEGQARALLADLLDWHRREDKPAWWRYFYLRTLSPAELIGEPDALGGLSGGEMVGQVKRSVVRRFRFPAQEHKFSAGGTACDPATDKQWSVCDVDDARGTIDLKMGSTYSGPWPAALTEVGPPRTGEQRDRLRDLGDQVVRDGVGGADAATALLLRRPPDDGGGAAGSLRGEGETASAAAVRLAVSLRRSYLPMQGPPGTGKTYTAAEQILELIAHGRTVGITGPSHAVICHLIEVVYEHARWRGAGIPRVGQRAERDNPHRHEDATTMSNEQPHRHALQRADQSHPASADRQRPDRVPGRDRGQVPGPGGSGRHLLHGDLVGGRGASRAGVPLRPTPAERRDLTGQGPGHHRGQPRSHPGVLPDPAADGPGERPVPGLGDGRLSRPGGCAHLAQALASTMLRRWLRRSRTCSRLDP